jgi:predicted adenine nucleotide alpha hydrolase (AANH) superfamily ATPase
MLFLKKIFSQPPRLLFHICCAPCATYVSLAILAKAFRITWYFYNPNLCCRAEYERRLAAVKLVATKYRFPLIVEPYDHAAWQAGISGWEGEPERGRRCQICYFDRLHRTATLAKEKGFAYFSTSLLVSPYKDTQAIRTISLQLAKETGLEFLDQDFQADDGYRRSQQLAKDLGLYRQKFCGCEYSLQPAV